jgi:hypothetical protein
LHLNPDDESLITDYLKLFDENIGNFQRDEQFYFYSKLESYLRNKGTMKFKRMSFDIYKKMLKNNLCNYKEGEYFNLIMFKNIIEISLILKEYDWLKIFINKNINKLHPDNRQNMLNYYRGQFEFNKGNFERSLHYISKVQSDIIDLKWDMRYLVLLIYYELNKCFRSWIP